MRDLIRLIGVGILVFLVVGFALIYSRDSAFRYGVSVFFSNGWGAIVRTFTWGGVRTDLKETELRLVRPKQRVWMGLATFPDQTEIRFPVPPVGGFHAGELDLQFDVQLAHGGDGLLSIIVNGTRRSEIVLNSGHNAYSVRVKLDEADLLADHVLVAFHSRGTTNSGQICPTEASNSGVAISILPESALVLKTMRDANDPETSLMVMPEPLMLQLTDVAKTQAITVWAMQRKKRAGVDARLVDGIQNAPTIEVRENGPEAVSLSRNGNVVLGGYDGIERAIAVHRADLLAPGALTQWPVSVSSLTTETSARNFRGSKRWRLPYKIADLPEGKMPTEFDLALKVSTLAEDLDWIVRVSLNGNLLHTERLPGDLPDMHLRVHLPTRLQGLSNSILIELIDTSPNESICRAGPDAQAQLLPESRLLADGEQPEYGWGALVRELAAAEAVSPGEHGVIDVVQATHAAEMLGQFLPVGANMQFSPGGRATMIGILNKEGLATIVEDMRQGKRSEMKDTYLIMDTGSSVINPLSLHRLDLEEGASLVKQMHSTDIAFIVLRPENP